MFKIQTLNKIASIGLDELPRDSYEIASEILNPDGVLVRSADMQALELPASLKAIARAGAGVNNIPVDKCSKRGIVVFNTPGANANGVKELVIAAMLLSSRRIIPGIEWTRTLKGKGKEVGPLVEKGKKDFIGPEIKGKKLGVIGLGAIGVMVANDALALGMDVMGYDPYISVEAAWGLARTVRRATSLDQLLSQSDYITLHVPLVEATKGLLGRSQFAIMKKGVRIMRPRRGERHKGQDKHCSDHRVPKCRLAQTIRKQHFEVPFGIFPGTLASRSVQTLYPAGAGAEVPWKRTCRTTIGWW